MLGCAAKWFHTPRFHKPPPPQIGAVGTQSQTLLPEWIQHNAQTVQLRPKLKKHITQNYLTIFNNRWVGVRSSKCWRSARDHMGLPSKTSDFTPSGSGTHSICTGSHWASLPSSQKRDGVQLAASQPYPPSQNHKRQV